MGKAKIVVVVHARMTAAEMPRAAVVVVTAVKTVMVARTVEDVVTRVTAARAVTVNAANVVTAKRLKLQRRANVVIARRLSNYKKYQKLLSPSAVKRSQLRLKIKINQYRT